MMHGEYRLSGAAAGQPSHVMASMNMVGPMAHPQMFDPEDPLLARVREIALSFPEAQEKVSHGRPAFFTKKIFAHYGGTRKLLTGGMEQHPHALLVLPDPMDAEVLLERPDSFVPMYLGPSGWIGLELESLDAQDLGDLLADSYRNTAPAKLVRQLSSETPPASTQLSSDI